MATIAASSGDDGLGNAVQTCIIWTRSSGDRQTTYSRDGERSYCQPQAVLSRDNQGRCALLKAQAAALVPDLFGDPHNVLAKNAANFFVAVALFEHQVGQHRHIFRSVVMDIVPIGSDRVATGCM